ncbi:hypothetical protein, partial [Rhizobium sp. SEMIA 4032]|uniref:hypothetical protein n=1 Tax=Rhizobium sp. SEMIA 4032 TaxID=2137762 RepID=UPI001AEC404B
GLGRLGPKPKTPGRFQTYLLFTMYSEQASVLADDANFYFFRRQLCTHAPKALREGAKRLPTRYRAVLLPHSTSDQFAHTGRQSVAPRGAARPERSDRKIATASGQNKWWS